MVMAKPVKKETVKKSYTVFYLILALVTFIVYYNSLSNGFVFDDDSVVLGDPTITSLSNIPNYFTGEMGFHKVIGRYYRPVVSATYAIDYSLWKFEPFGFHLTNVLIHIINVLLLFKLLTLMFEQSKSKFRDYAIMAGALVFALHPIHTEAVAWVSGRTDSLSCTFFFAAFIYYFKYTKLQSNRNLGLLLLYYLLALLSKEMAITLPVVIILYDIIVNRMNLSADLRQKTKVYVSLAVVSVLYLLLRWYVLKDVPERGSYFYFYGKEYGTVFYTMLQTLPYYFKLAVFPIGMVYHYSGFLPFLSSPLEPGVIFAILFMAAIGVCSWYLYKRMPVVSYALLFFFITLSPVLNIIPTMNFMGDRFLYIPSVFLSLIVIAVLIKYYTPKLSNVIYGLTGALLITFGYMTIDRNSDWKDNDTLFLSAEGIPGTVLYVNIGNIYANKGQYDVAEKYYRKAIDMRIETVLGNNNLGKLFMIYGNNDSAYYYMHKAHTLDTLSPEPMHALATMYARSDNFTEAVSWLEKIQKVAPNYMNSAQMLQELKLREEMSRGNLNDNRKLPPGIENKLPQDKSFETLEQSSYNNYKAKNYSKAIEELNELLKLNPSGASGYYNNIGMCYLDDGKYKEAIDSFTESVKIDPLSSSGFNNIGHAYEKLGNTEMARKNYQKAVELDPNNQLAKENLEKLK
jgi:tetratricopeptide (TPR) repeat protein